MSDLVLHEGVRQAETIFFLLLLLIIGFGALARRLEIAYPIVLVVAGVLISFIPGLPKFTLNPDIVFLMLLPPLLFHAAWQTSWREFHYNIVSILMLAIGLVIFTVLGVALASLSLFTLFTWRTGIVLGAIVAPTDALAATSIARRVGLSGRATHVLEGESLVNDATGLLALELGLAIVLGGHTPTVAQASMHFVWLTVAGIGTGVAVAWVVRQCEKFLDDGPIEITLSLVTPYVAYFVAEEVGASGVLAVVACGLYFGRHSSEFFSHGVRLQAVAVWKALDFVLNGLAFVLIGLQLPTVLAGLHHYGTGVLFAYASGFSALVIALRLIWVYPGAYLSYVIRRRVFKQQEQLPSLKALFIVGWTGMRGVVSLAAAMSLPELMSDGRQFAARDLIIFLTFSTILVTLVLQGFSLPPLIRLLGFNKKSEPDHEEHEARRLMIAAALAHLTEREKRHSDDPEMTRLLRKMKRRQQSRLILLRAQADVNAKPFSHARFRELSREILRIERSTAIALRNEGKINDILLRRLENELDLSQSRIDAD
ncbi:Na+/H+ antiporter [Paraburkholderia sp. BL25I1N1]|uniref:Na+/H+ antiporter n=1 Tax=Paraburkholderia sp. BL25I1N1 TaxID=1938804 RepID=UPI000D04E810|nr:Na+/H+ antiporter [Paraburkholderia sp. BL25I1N1]PRY04470.1 sodium/proton antiporter (CPA1 family) [Paraburkholderia sp. BL25I1N1]